MTDDDGDTAMATVTIGVGNAAPAITALNPLTATTNQELTLTVTASDPDTDGSIANYKWDLNNDATFEVDSGTVPSTLATFTTPGTQTIGVQSLHERYRYAPLTSWSGGTALRGRRPPAGRGADRTAHPTSHSR